jgi:hypothetical protein
MHRECLLRGVIGSVGHQMKLCECYGVEDISEDGLTLHEAAIASFNYWQRVNNHGVSDEDSRR